MKYLVIGGTGVMGHYVVRELVSRGHRPVILTVSGNTRYIVDLLEKVEVVKGDVMDHRGIAEVVGGHSITHIAHLGSAVGPAAEEDPRWTMQVGVEGMVNVLEAAHSNGVQRVVFASSKTAYGIIQGKYTHPTYHPLPEDYPSNPINAYGISKLAAEHLGMMYQKRYGVEFLALRFASTVGPGKLEHHGQHSVHNQIIENAMAGQSTMIPQGEDSRRDTLYNADAALGIVCAMDAPTPAHTIYHIGAGLGIKLQRFVDAVRVFYPKAEVSIGPGAGPPLLDCVLDISRARKELDYNPRYNAETMVADYIKVMKRLRLKPTPT